jgi:phosphorylase kinase alpha/beta subunit
VCTEGAYVYSLFYFLLSLHTGEEVESTSDYNHMQLDCVSLYLLYLVQMISSGLEIIYRYQQTVLWIRNRISKDL